MIGLPGKANTRPTSEQKKQEAALAKLMKERQAYSKRTGSWPTDAELYKSRKKSR